MIKRMTLLLTLCTLLILCLSSCWSKKELNTLAIVIGSGLDVGDKPGTIKLTAQVVRPSKIRGSSPTDGSGSEKSYVNMTYTERSVLSAVRGISHLQNRRLYFAHNDVLIFSKELAKLDIIGGLDPFTRDYEARMNVYILIAQGKASEILEEDADLEKAPALHIAGMMENQKANSETVVVTLRDFAIATLSESTAPVAPMIEVYEVAGEKKVKLEGTAVFKNGVMIGELDKAQTQGFLWVTGKAKAAAMNVDTQWGQVVLEILHFKSSLKPIKTEAGEIRMQLSMDVDGIIQSNETAENMSRLENVEMLKIKMKELIQANIEDALAGARGVSADIFGFGDAIRRNYPEEWEKMRRSWGEIFPQIQLDIQLNEELTSTGGLSKPIVPGGVK